MKTLVTRKGEIELPAFLPVTTFGSKYPLDSLVRPYLPRLAQAAMVSLHYAKQQEEAFSLPLFVDSGGFACLFDNARVVDENGLGVLELDFEDRTERTTPEGVLRFQEERAEIAATLDFPIPPGLDSVEAERRQRLTIQNAIWALENRKRKDLLLFACVQAWDAQSAARAARELARHAFDGFAIGGLVPRARNRELSEEIVRAVRENVGDAPIHVFGLGKPDIIRWLVSLGVDSTDSSGYIKLAADGKTWSGEAQPHPSPVERMRLALENLKLAASAIAP